VGDGGAQDHGGGEDEEDGAVALGLSVVRARGAQLVVGGEDLGEDRAQFAHAGRDAVAGGPVARREDLAGDNVRGCVGTCGAKSESRAAAKEKARDASEKRYVPKLNASWPIT